MRYLRQNRRRIELFVEALRTWFETCARFEAVRSRQTPRADNGPFLLREAAAVSEYRAASRAGAAFQEPECEPVPEERVRPSHEGASGTSGWRAVLRSEEARPADRRLAAAALFEALWGKGLTADALGALDLFANGLASSSSAQAGEEMLRLLGALAKPPLREAWPGAWRRLAERSSGEARQVLDFLKPVCEVLGGSKRVTLDSLPPEQREFALEVLGAFEPEAGRRARVLDRPRLGLPEPPR
jgi:hypothetical protein